MQLAKLPRALAKAPSLPLLARAKAVAKALARAPQLPRVESVESKAERRSHDSDSNYEKLSSIFVLMAVWLVSFVIAGCAPINLAPSIKYGC